MTALIDTRLSAYGVIVDPDERMLLAHLTGSMPDSGRWTLPGGGVDPDETMEQAAIREIREETGYRAELGAMLGHHIFSVAAEKRLKSPMRPLVVIQVIYTATVIEGDLTYETDGSTDEAMWIPIPEVEATPHVELVDVALAMWRSKS